MNRLKDDHQSAALLRSKAALTILTVLFAVMGISTLRSVITNPSAEHGRRNIAMAKGKHTAPVQITEYLDYQCPSCSEGALFLDAYIKEHPERIRLEVKLFPLELIHVHAVRAARYAECAALQGKFWTFHTALLMKQPEWKDLRYAEPLFEQIARNAGLDRDRLDRCLADDAGTTLILTKKAEGVARGVRSTPTYFINGKMIVGPASLKDELRSHFTDVPH